MDKIIRNNFSKIEEFIGDRTIIPSKEEFDYQDYRKFTWYETICEGISGLAKGDINSEIFFKQNKEKIYNWISEVKKEYSRKIPIFQKNLGLDYNSLIKTSNDFLYYLEKSKLIDLISKDNYEDNSSLHFYSPFISFFQNYFEDEPNKTIVEIGCGIQGLGTLSYLGKNFKVKGLERRGLDDKILENFHVPLIKGKWEDIERYFEENSVDAFYFNYMHPSPFMGGKFDTENFHKSYADFSKHIKEKMHVLLKKDGLIVQRNLGDKYIGEFLLGGKDDIFSRTKIPIESRGKTYFMSFYDSEKSSFRKELFPLQNYKEDWNFGSHLTIFQKE
jgi:hypothetical protein